MLTVNCQLLIEMNRVLIITYYWPPSGGSGVQRWLKMSKYLPKNGWQPVIYTADGAEYPVEDMSLEKDIAPETEVLRHEIVEPYSFYKKFLGIKKDEKIKAGFINEGKKKSSWKENVSVWLRGNLFIPDARCWWIRPSVKFLKKYLKSNPVDAIISTGPPHSMHLIAKKLHKKFNIPWIADFRDPWTDIDFYKDLRLTKWADRIHRRMEKSVLLSANEIVTVGNHCAQGLKKICGRDIKIITNGYDFNIDELNNNTNLTDKFTLSHIGIIGANRNPILFWEAIKELVQDDVFAKSLNIRLIGQIDQSVIKSINDNGIGQFVEIIPYIPHSEVLEKQSESQVLLLFINNTPNAKSVLTGKLFEYMASGRPILSIGPSDGDTAAILQETQTGVNVDFLDKDRIKIELKNLFSKYLNNNLSTSHNGSVDKYSRNNLTAEYVKLLNSL